MLKSYFCFSSLGWQEIKILPEKQFLLIFSTLKWWVALVAKRRVPMTKALIQFQKN
jgi:hypothetical protein